jgi:hypothetical protein
MDTQATSKDSPRNNDAHTHEPHHGQEKLAFKGIQDARIVD